MHVDVWLFVVRVPAQSSTIESLDLHIQQRTLPLELENNKVETTTLTTVPVRMNVPTNELDDLSLEAAQRKVG